MRFVYYCRHLSSPDTAEVCPPMSDEGSLIVHHWSAVIVAKFPDTSQRNCLKKKTIQTNEMNVLRGVNPLELPQRSHTSTNCPFFC